MKITVMIATRNRRSDLERTCEVLTSLTPPPDAVIICADGCTDDTVEMVQSRFPQFQLLVNTEGKGSVPTRERMLREISADIVVSLDDDSYPLEKDFFAQLPLLFAAHPEAAVITFPEIRNEGESANPTKTPNVPGHYVSAYPNCAAAMRLDIYRESAGFPSFFCHMYEEPDYALQCYGLGYSVWFEPSLRIRHHLSAKQREPVTRHHQNARNEIWSVWMRCPWPYVLLVTLLRLERQFLYALSEGVGWALKEPVWWWQAIGGAARCLKHRRPIPWRVYFAWMRLARGPINDRAQLNNVFDFSRSL